MTHPEIVLAAPVRTALGAFNGALKDIPATDLGAAAIRETLRRSGVDVSKVDSVTFGNVIQAGNRMNPARQAAIGGGLGVSVPALTVNRVCGSGAQAIVSAANEISAGFSQLAVAGGMENMDRAPYLLEKARFGYRMGNAEIIDSMLRDGLDDAFSGKHSGWHTEDLVTQMDITREAQDRFAERSQQRFAAAQKKGFFNGEIVGLEVKAGKQSIVFDTDEQSRPDTTFETLSRLRPAFRPDGTITAGNAPGLNSGASAMLVTNRAFADQHGIDAPVRLAAYGIAAVEPGLFGLGPVPAVQQALARAGWTLADVERIEINEAFAAVPLAVARTLSIPLDIVNPEGGAIAHGHAIGATGAVLVTRLVHAMLRDGLKRAMVTLCIGGGQGIALALETI
jgi:acetyl-CoA C-acetyltransferase